MKNEDNFDKLNEELMRAHKIGWTAVAMALDSEAKRRAPVLTGNLRSSINNRTDDTGAYCDANAEYSVFVEYGTSRQPSQEFLRPALYDNSRKLKDLYVKQIAEALK